MSTKGQLQRSLLKNSASILQSCFHSDVAWGLAMQQERKTR